MSINQMMAISFKDLKCSKCQEVLMPTRLNNGIIWEHSKQDSELKEAMEQEQKAFYYQQEVRIRESGAEVNSTETSPRKSYGGIRICINDGKYLYLSYENLTVNSM